MEHTYLPTHSLWRVLMIVALGLLVWVLRSTIVSGLFWSGWSFNVAFGPALAGVVIVVWVGWRRPVLYLVVPFVSALIAYGLHAPFLREYMSCEGHSSSEVHSPLAVASSAGSLRISQ